MARLVKPQHIESATAHPGFEVSRHTNLRAVFDSCLSSSNGTMGNAGRMRTTMTTKATTTTDTTADC